MKEPIDLIKEYLHSLQERTEFASIEEKAEYYGLVNSYEMAIDQLNLCEEHGVTGGSKIHSLPDEDIHQCFRVVHECESSDPCNWVEYKPNNREIILSGGDLVVQR